MLKDELRVNEALNK